MKCREEAKIESVGVSGCLCGYLEGVKEKKEKENSDWFYSCLEFLVAVAVKWASGMLMTGMLFSSRGSWPLKSQPRHKSIPICHGDIRGSHLVAQNWGQFVWREACVRSECYMCKSRHLYSALMAQSKIFSVWALRAFWRLVENPAEKWLCWARGQSNPTLFIELGYYSPARGFYGHISMLGRVVGKYLSLVHNNNK